MSGGRACPQCSGTDTARECAQGQCYAEGFQRQEAEEQERQQADLDRRYREDPPQ